MRKIKLIIILISIISITKAQSSQNDAISNRAKLLHKKIITIDSHIDIRPDFNSGANDAGKETIDQIDLPKLERGGLNVATIALFADPDIASSENNIAAQKKVAAKYEALQRWVNAYPNKLEFAKSYADIIRIKQSGKHAILLSFLNSFWFNKNLNLIDTFYKRGVRVFGFDHAGNTDFAGSSRPIYGEASNIGLSELGEKAVERLNKLGILIDVSQLSTPAFYKVVELSKSPVIATHSGIRHIVDVTRNLSEDELKAIASKGGVVQIVAFAAYLKKDSIFSQAYLNAVAKPFGLTPLKDNPKEKLSAADYQKYQNAYLNFSRNEWKYATLEDYINSVDYAVKLIGIDHVGLSSDFNHGGGVIGFSSVADILNVTKELLKRGYSDDDIKKLWGGNFLRVLQQAENISKKS